MNSPGVKVQILEPEYSEVRGICLVERRSVYGNVLYYPSNDVAKTFCELVNKKTLDTLDFRRIKRLGFTVELQTSGGIDL